jgi:hypothetical protein
MSETPIKAEAPTPAQGRGKRRGLALPPPGQTLTRLQDLEADIAPAVLEDSQPVPVEVSPPPVTASRDAVRTASSNAVNDDVSTAKASPPAPTAPEPAGRAAREPTTRITVDMPDSLHRRISLLSVEERRSIKDLVIDALHRTYFPPGPATEGEGR